MRNINTMLKDAGVPPTFIGIISLVITITIVGIIAFVFIFDSIRDIPFPPWLVLILGALSQFVIVLLTSTHTTNTINGTAAQTAAQTAIVVENNASNTQAQVQAATQAQLASQKQADAHALELQIQRASVTQAQENEAIEVTKDNTEATRENTRKMEGK